MMQHRIRMAIVCLHISAAIYVFLGLIVVAVFQMQQRLEAQLPLAMGLLILCLALAGGVEFVVRGLRRRKYWAWVTGLCIFGLYVPSGFLPLGVLGLWGLLDKRSRAEFGVSVGNSRATGNPGQ